MYIFDIDGTLADCTHRLHHIIGDEKDWDAYDAEGQKDTPIGQIIEICNALYDKGWDIMLLTGRNERVRECTETWLKKYGVMYDVMLMRGLKDRREDTIVKKELLDTFLTEQNIYPAQIESIFEDRQRLVDMFRAEGYQVCQVAKGDF